MDASALFTHVLLFAPVLVAPMYWLITRKRRGSYVTVRRALWLIFAGHLLLGVPIAVELPRLLRTDVGMFDDAMYGLLAVGMLSGIASAVTILLGITLSSLRENNTNMDSTGGKTAGPTSAPADGE